MGRYTPRYNMPYVMAYEEQVQRQMFYRIRISLMPFE